MLAKKSSLAQTPVTDQAAGERMRDLLGAGPAPGADYTNVTHRTAQEMQQRILSSEWPEGARLPSQRQLCEELGVSRTALREATAILSAQGYLSVEVGRGVFVHPRAHWPAEEKDIHHRRYDKAQIMQFRFLLEGWAAELAADRIDSSGLETLSALIESMDEALDMQDIARLDQLDEAFHNTIAKASGHDLLCDILDIVQSAYSRRERRPPHKGRTVRVISRRVDEHRLIFAGLEAGDQAEAKRAMQMHIFNLATRNQIDLRDLLPASS